MTTATMRLIEAVERLNMSGEIGDGMVAHLHDLAAGARLEQPRPHAILERVVERGADGRNIGYMVEHRAGNPPRRVTNGVDLAG